MKASRILLVLMAVAEGKKRGATVVIAKAGADSAMAAIKGGSK